MELRRRLELPAHRHVATTDDGTIVGWAAVSAFSSRPACVGVVEHSVFFSPDARGFGIGTAPLQALINSTEAAGIWTNQASVFP